MQTNRVTEILPGPMCNIADSGRRRRRLGAYASAGITVVVFIVCLVLQVPWFSRLLLFVPAVGAATGFLQARRSVCLGRATEGTIEGEDGSTRKAEGEALVQHRKVAATILRDSVLIGIVAAALGAASSFIR